MPEKWSEEKLLAALDKGKQTEARAGAILSGLKRPSTVLLVLKPEAYSSVKNFLLSSRVAGGEKVIFVSLNMPAEKALGIVGQKLKKSLFVIDMFSGKNECQESENYACLGSATHLAECADLIESTLAKIGGNSAATVIIDSVPALLLYNEQEAVKRFLHLVLSKAQTANASAALIGIEEKDREGFYKIIGQFVDSTITL